MSINRKQKKRSPSAHQKQIRFFIILFGILSFLLVFGLLWLINRSSAFP